jgi:hypothetical protein
LYILLNKVYTKKKSKVVAMISKGPSSRRKLGGIRTAQCISSVGWVNDLFLDNVA